MSVREIAGVGVFVCDADGPPIATERDAVDLVGAAFGTDVIAIPRTRLTADFFRLRTRLAGEVLQKLGDYRFKVAIVGDVSAEIATSDALRDFVRECNRGRQVWFVEDLAGLERRLAG